jgi:hypothetical protein
MLISERTKAARNRRHDHCSTLPADPLSAGDHLFRHPRLLRAGVEINGFDPWHDEWAKWEAQRNSRADVQQQKSDRAA